MPPGLSTLLRSTLYGTHYVTISIIENEIDTLEARRRAVLGHVIGSGRGGMCGLSPRRVQSHVAESALGTGQKHCRSARRAGTGHRSAGLGPELAGTGHSRTGGRIGTGHQSADQKPTRCHFPAQFCT